MIELFLLFTLLIGSHEMGHQVEADRLNKDIRWSGTNWIIEDIDKDDLGVIINAAFQMQDNIGYGLKSKKFNILNGLYKTQYLLRDELDMNNTTHHAKMFIALSAISDLSNNGVRFIQYNENTSGLIKTWRF